MLSFVIVFREQIAGVSQLAGVSERLAASYGLNRAIGIAWQERDEVISKSTETALRQCGFLRDVDEGHLSRFLQLAKPADFAAGELILREGDVAINVYVILFGNASLELCASGVGCRRIMTLAEGDLLSWSVVLGQTRLTATVRAISEIQAVEGGWALRLRCCGWCRGLSSPISRCPTTTFA